MSAHHLEKDVDTLRARIQHGFPRKILMLNSKSLTGRTANQRTECVKSKDIGFEIERVRSRPKGLKPTTLIQNFPKSVRQVLTNTNVELQCLFNYV